QQRIAHQRARDGEHLLLAAAHMGAAAMGDVAEIGKDGEGLVRGPRWGRAAVWMVADPLPADVEIFGDGEVGEDAPVLGHEAEPAARDLERLEIGDVFAEKTDGAAALR